MVLFLPDAHTVGLLGTLDKISAQPDNSVRNCTHLVPHGSDKHQTGSNSALENTQKDSSGDEASPVLCCASYAYDETPLSKCQSSLPRDRDCKWPRGTTHKADHSAQILCGWQSLHAVRMRKFASQVAHIKDHSQQAELSSGDVCILLETHDVGVVDESFI